VAARGIRRNASRHQAEPTDRMPAAVRTHETRNLLVAIDSATHALSQPLARVDSEEWLSLIAAIRHEVNRLAATIDERRQDEASRLFPLAELVHQITRCVSTRHCRLTVTVPDRLVAYGRPDAFALALRNVLDNALRYGNGRIGVSAYAHGRHASIVVDDDGPGFAADEHEHVFAPFTRGSAAHRAEGSGIGLALAKGVVAHQAGSIRIGRSSWGGARVTLTLPRSVPRHPGQRADHTHEPVQRRWPGNLARPAAPEHSQGPAAIVEHQDGGGADAH
jgi:signal transduction histidine kinase